MPCQVYPERYQQQLEEKRMRVQSLLPDTHVPISVFASPTEGYRMRAEFRVWHEQEHWYYVMFDATTKRRIIIQDCPMVTPIIRDIMQPLRDALLRVEALSARLYAIDFLASSIGELLITLIYKRPLDATWDDVARSLQLPPHVMLMGRSRGKKRVLTRDYVNEDIQLPRGQQMRLRHVENAFSQPNAAVNHAMLSWVDTQVLALPPLASVLELYGGVGNFTWVLAQHAPSVIMTELSKQAVDAAQHAFQAAGLSHVSIAVMDSEQVSRSLSQTLQGTQLRWQGQDYDIDLVLVDPPRAGLDDTTRQLLSHFTHIIYISCNPDTLARDLLAWQETHDITAVAIFDQFPYTHHIETGVILRKQSIKGSS